ncbi:MAG: ABC transporter ATP-binding protein [Deltaproteobacteria bacterium]
MLEVKSLVKYFGGLAASASVDFQIAPGEVVGLIGPNGAGKTTIFNLISGHLAPTSGTIVFKGRDITGRKPHQICRLGIARTFQLVNLFGSMNVLENVKLASLFGVSKAVRTAHADKEAGLLLKFVGLSDLARTPARDLTVANQKRLEVARALATQPDLLLLDEVMAGLNPTEVAEAMELIDRIRSRGVTIFMIEHVMKAIMGVSDRIIVLHYGVKLAEGTPEEIASHDRVREIYLGT